MFGRTNIRPVKNGLNEALHVHVNSVNLAYGLKNQGVRGLCGCPTRGLFCGAVGFRVRGCGSQGAGLWESGCGAVGVRV